MGPPKLSLVVSLQSPIAAFFTDQALPSDRNVESATPPGLDQAVAASRTAFSQSTGKLLSGGTTAVVTLLPDRCCCLLAWIAVDGISDGRVVIVLAAGFSGEASGMA